MACVNDHETLWDMLKKAGVKFEEGQEMVSFADKTKAPQMLFLITTVHPEVTFVFDNHGKLKGMRKDREDIDQE